MSSANYPDEGKMKGLTLIELMVVIAIIAILASFSFVDYTSWVESQKAQDSVERLYKLIMLARTKSFFEKKKCGVCWDSTENVREFSLKCDNNGNGRLDDNETMSTEKLKFGFRTPDRRCVEFYLEGFTKDVGTFELESDVDVPYRKIVVSKRKIRKEKN